MPIIQQRALLEGHEVEIFKLVSKGATTRQWAEWLRVPLEHAAARGDFDLVDRLLKAGANGSAGWRGCRRRTLLDAAALGGNADVLSALLQAGCGPDVNSVSSSSRRSALYQAIVGKHEAAARRLIIAGADVNYEDPTDRATPLYAAAVTAQKEGLVRDLLIAGARPNARARHHQRRTPLHGAAELGLEKIVSALLDTPSTEKDALDDRGLSPLMLASRHGDASTVDNLLHAGADLTLRDDYDNNSAMESAVEAGHAGVVTALLDHGDDVHDSGSCWTPLHGAALFDHEDVVRVLVDAGADLDSTDSPEQETPLELAAKHGSDAALLALLRRGADPNKSAYGGSPLHIAVSGENYHMDKTVDLLLRWGASETAVNDMGKTPAQHLHELCWEADETKRALELLASAPVDRAWRRRSWLVILRARAEKKRMNRRSRRRRRTGGGSRDQEVRGDQVRGAGTGVELRGLVDVLLGLESDGIFRAVVGYL